MEKQLTNNNLLLILLVVTCVLFFSVGFFFGKKTEKSTTIIQDTSLFKKQADELRNEIEVLKSTIVVHEKSIAEKDSLLKANTDKKTDIKNKANEKISDTKLYDIHMWELFFTDRYQ
jgi:preprotein translocase subunit SecF